MNADELTDEQLAAIEAWFDDVTCEMCGGDGVLPVADPRDRSVTEVSCPFCKPADPLN